MANDEVLGPRKTMFVLVIVVGCFAVLWPRILSPLILGPSRDQIKPNQFDREAGCCEVLFDKDMAIMELLNEVCSYVTHTEKLSPYSAAECRRTVNETCGVDIAAYLKRSNNVGKTSKMLVETMKNSNSSCLREHFGVPVWSLGPHIIQNSWTQQDTLKQERPPIRGAAPHPALLERGRAIPAGSPAPPTRSSVAMPPHIRPPPIPGMRPPLGSPGGPVPAPKSSMGFVMPIYTICIIVFFVYTLSKILFKRTGTSPYEPLTPDPQFRRRVFRDDSRTSPDKLVVTAISGLVAEVQQQMEASYTQNQQRQDVQQDNHTRPYTNGTIIHNSGPVHIVASEYREPSKERTEEHKEENKNEAPVADRVPASNDIKASVETSDSEVEANTESIKDPGNTEKNTADEQIELKPEATDPEQSNPEPILEIDPSLEVEKDSEPEPESTKSITNTEDKEEKEIEDDIVEVDNKFPEEDSEIEEEIIEEERETDEQDREEIVEEEEQEDEELELDFKDGDKLTKNFEVIEAADTQLKATAKDMKIEKNGDIRKTQEFLQEETNAVAEEKDEKQSTPELLEDAIKDDEDDEDNEKSSVKVVGMEMTAHMADGGACTATKPAPAPVAPAATPRAHEAESVQSIYLETEIPQQSRVLVADFGEDLTDKPQPTKHSPMVVSGKMTLSLIQDAPRETPERDPESTVDEFTTASAVTQNAPEKQEEESDEEIEEEIEIEEIEEEVEEEEEQEVEPKEKESSKTSK